MRNLTPHLIGVLLAVAVAAALYTLRPDTPEPWGTVVRTWPTSDGSCIVHGGALVRLQDGSEFTVLDCWLGDAEGREIVLGEDAAPWATVIATEAGRATLELEGGARIVIYGVDLEVGEALRRGW